MVGAGRLQRQVEEDEVEGCSLACAPATAGRPHLGSERCLRTRQVSWILALTSITWRRVVQARCVAALRPAVAGLPWHVRDLMMLQLRVSLSAGGCLLQRRRYTKCGQRKRCILGACNCCVKNATHTLQLHQLLQSFPHSATANTATSAQQCVKQCRLKLRPGAVNSWQQPMCS